jgi:RHH-type proline utilization regulon transcriptional repressor/proline dehydrogenase/delta 1-pyrroline-5-carboxylate dehydrogenase
MLKGAMNELLLGNPWQSETDVGPIIDVTARDRILAYIASRRNRLVHQLVAPQGGTYVPPTILRVAGIADIPEEIFGPVLHVATFKADAFDAVITDINAAGYGLTFGLHTRIASRVERVSTAIMAGNIYINRNQIGAVVGSQPFGGERLSGTGPKAGGPHYLPRFTHAAPDLQDEPMVLPGPTGESNVLYVVPRDTLLCLGPSGADREAQRLLATHLHMKATMAELDISLLEHGTGYGAVAWFGDRSTLAEIRLALSRRDGALLPLLGSDEEGAKLQVERHVCIDTTAAGGNAKLLALAV